MVTNYYIYLISKNDSMPKEINTADHCFGCTAGSGSSCGGILV